MTANALQKPVQNRRLGHDSNIVTALSQFMWQTPTANVLFGDIFLNNNKQYY